MAVVMLLASSSVFSQDHHKRNEVFIELAGNGLWVPSTIADSLQKNQD